MTITVEMARIALQVIKALCDVEPCPDYHPDCIDCQANQLYHLIEACIADGEFPMTVEPK